ncbi:MAG TPA: zf-HC2 domain-containing protein, partial [Gammaproteobacteria bacterium]|nr:zf-HC2 domain-containing protein [Gammaproteobacteria bacterium]
MTATSQHEIHPDAEHLNAFAEQALSERERGEVLGHLAVCDRCRQVVALAREAAVAETAVGVVATAGKSKGQPRRVWWKEWRLALAPVAALAMTAVVVSYVYERRVERPAQMAQSTPPAALKSEEPPAIPDQAEVPAPPPPASPAARPETNKQKAEGSGAAARQHAPE